jgi:maltose alpha-D-glucosyltransferase/alpha-amylase
LRQEDRRPIIEILERTPAIPDTCQWGIFLRNHDELTLEMVTDEERDYMYREYARDPRMRINVGIRRRLAPLLDNSRRRMELLNSLLLSLPGTPILYYGDEIGMGDNVFLGDRNGVRTPMQWSADRNAGFSKADPAGLYLPVIMDPVYGYTAINVEAHERDPSSLLHFMRRMIALRRQHKAFGRGSIEFLRPENRKVLVYLRRYKADVILVVANLSRFVQPVELDLSSFNGWVPVEMIGRTEFPAIGEWPYFLTLGPHSFYWFRLEPPAESVLRNRTSEHAPCDIPVWNLGENWNGFLEQPLQHLLEQEILPTWLPGQRWFRSKSRTITGVTLKDWAKIGGGFFLVFAEVHCDVGNPESYCLPLKIVTGQTGQRLAGDIPESVLARFKTSKGEGIVFDALADRVSCRILFDAIAENRHFPTVRGGTVQAFATEAFESLFANEAGFSQVRLLEAEQSNSSVILNDRAFLKLYRRMEAGINPDFAINLHLTEHTDFTALAQVAGGILLNTEGKTSSLVMLQPYLDNDGDGWSLAIDSARSFVEKTRDLAPEQLERLVAVDLLEAAEEYGQGRTCGLLSEDLALFSRLGTTTAEFHLALAAAKKQAAFKPKPLDTLYLTYLADGCADLARQTLERLQVDLPQMPHDLEELTHRVLALGDRLTSSFQDLAVMKSRAQRIRCHGDYHLGQVLRRGLEWILLDFEGEPLRSLSERQQQHSPFKDVAGMLRSFAYASMHVQLRFEGAEKGQENLHIAELAGIWERWCRSAFLHGYLYRAEGAAILPAREKHRRLLLTSFLLDKACYEVNYELDNRPEWLRIPLQSMVELLDGVGGGS